MCMVPAELHGERVDRALASLIPEFSRSYLQQLLVDGAVLLRGVLVRKPAARVSAGDALQVELRPTPQAQAFVPQAIPLNPVFEDEHLLVIDKSAGLVVHPAAGNWTGTLLNGLLAYHAGAAALPRAGIVHRLDKDTSGLMLVAKSRQAMDALVRAIAAREVDRRYLALAQGGWEGPRQQEVDQAIGRDVHNRLRMSVVRPDGGVGKPAQTTVRLLETQAQACLVACKLHTGRTHQIRVHMAWLGHPLVGDALYGGRPLWGMQRQALHAARLQLRHPVHGGLLQFRSTPPHDMLQALADSGLRYNEALVSSGFQD
ncbi:RluA family pseudouridine synthase [Hydrogenophaga sp.]|uniref:RluA family pseudouridine synthase n=1 Tax=Hydrogenophaga sp. TaxID=1904254 RepID=UPI00260F7EE0|nr:RluA family pseudouridine synthase [Hydrogenophaga sp.]